MSEPITRDVGEEPWSTVATVIVDVASIAHWVRDEVRGRVVSAHQRSGADGEPPGTPLWTMTRGLHRIVDVLEHHGVRTHRLLLGLTLDAFPTEESGWKPAEPPDDEQARWKRRKAIENAEKLLARVTDALAGRGVVVEGLPGLFGASGEHCVDELCVLAAAHASWTGDGSDVIVVSRDADVAVAPLLTGRGRILLARRMNAEDARALAGRSERHGTDGSGGTVPHLRLLGLAMRRLLLPEDLPEGRLRDLLATLPEDEVPPVELAELEGRHVLRNARNVAQILSTPLDVPPDRTWLERRQPLLDCGVRSVAVVDPFGLLAAANKSGIPGRVPTAESVAEALEPLSLPLPMGQLAVVPDLLDADHGIISVADRVGGRELVPRMREVLTARVQRSLLYFDEEMESSLDSYHEDDLPETVGTPSQFARGPLTRIGRSPAALEEKESAVLLAADLLWALMHTDGPVVLVSERPDLVALMDLLDRLFGQDLNLHGRLTRVGLHADPFTGEGISVKRSGRTTSWSTMLMTGRMIVDLLRIEDDGRPDGETRVRPETVTEAVAFDPTLGTFAVRDLGGHVLGEVALEDIIQVPVEDLGPIERGDRRDSLRLLRALARDLRLHLDLRRPLPRVRLTRPGEHGVIGGTVLSARIVEHRAGGVAVRLELTGDAGVVVEATAPPLAALPEIGRNVEVVVGDDGVHIALTVPDLAGIPDTVGRPRPARVTGGGRAVLLVPLDPTDVRTDIGAVVNLHPLFGPYPKLAKGDVVLVTTLDEGLAQVVSTPLGWVDAIRS
jgi:hypothetical protein